MLEYKTTTYWLGNCLKVEFLLVVETAHMHASIWRLLLVSNT